MLIDVDGLRHATLPWEEPRSPPDDRSSSPTTHLQRRRWGAVNHPGRGDRAGGGRLQALLTHMQRDRLRPAPRRGGAHPPTTPLQPARAAAGVRDGMAFHPRDQHFKIPHGIFMREATAVGVDSEDNVYVFNRGNVPVLVFNPAGDLID
eukprot:COSAG04_NODE_7378_length_1137_cov_3.691715_1_plen_148_part_01